MSKKHIILEILVKNHVALFLKKEHGDNPISFYNTLPDYGLQVLKETYHKLPDTFAGSYAKIKVKVRRSVYESQTIVFQENRLIDLLPIYLELHFGEMLVNWILSARHNSDNQIKIKDAIASFKAYYDLDEDTYSTEACKQVWHRSLQLRKPKELIK